MERREQAQHREAVPRDELTYNTLEYAEDVSEIVGTQLSNWDRGGKEMRPSRGL